MENAISFLFPLAVLVFSVVLHEVSHGYVANALGDPTAKYAGRLTLNPIPHIDPVGSILVPLASWFLGGFVIGWARPVPYDPRNIRLRNTEFGAALIGAAGPGVNIAIALIFGLVIRFTDLWQNAVGAAASPMLEIFVTITIVNLFLAIFNLIPIPPLDGSKVLFWLLPGEWWQLRQALEQYGFFILLFFIFALSNWIVPIVRAIFGAITGIPL
ncbi:site-2 protease family protein [Candidatus Parcubacteria bacterium]|nr:MAG: site-2 protease family protein [Candidatus Parcubacteria bacterium]